MSSLLAMTTSNSTATVSLYLLTVLHECLRRQDNVSAMAAGVTLPDSESESTAGSEGALTEGEQDTDKGAVMYIAAVLVFYSLGIVVMIIKYLKTERKEIEEEMMLESFFKGIPSKRIEHEREAVHRVAIRAFHTLTSNAAQNEQLLIAAAATADAGSDSNARGPRHQGSVPEDSDDSSGLEDPSDVLRREKLKYLPRVSLMFRESRSLSDRRRQDSARSMRGRSLQVDQSESAPQSSDAPSCGQPLAGRDVVGGRGGTEGDVSSESVDSHGNCRTSSGTTAVKESGRSTRRCKRDSLRMLRTSGPPQCSATALNDDQESGFGSGTPDEGGASPRLEARGVSRVKDTNEALADSSHQMQPHSDVSGAPSLGLVRRLLESDV